MLTGSENFTVNWPLKFIFVTLILGASKHLNAPVFLSISQPSCCVFLNFTCTLNGQNFV
jgi:hypothetical protein